jgi:hypothetical protein
LVTHAATLVSHRGFSPCCEPVMPLQSRDVTPESLWLMTRACSPDSNRQRIASQNHLQLIIQQLHNPRLSTIVVPVLFNICSDYGRLTPSGWLGKSANHPPEPAQQLASEDKLYPILIAVLERGSLAATPFLGYLCNLLHLSSQKRNCCFSSRTGPRIADRTQLIQPNHRSTRSRCC